MQDANILLVIANIGSDPAVVFAETKDLNRHPIYLALNAILNVGSRKLITVFDGLAVLIFRCRISFAKSSTISRVMGFVMARISSPFVLKVLCSRRLCRGT